MPYNYLGTAENVSKLYLLLILFSNYFRAYKSTLSTNFTVVFVGISPETTTKFT